LRYVAEGIENYKVDGKYYKLIDNNFIITNPMQEVQLKIDSKFDVFGRCFFINPSLFGEIKSSLKNTIDYCLKISVRLFVASPLIGYITSQYKS